MAIKFKRVSTWIKGLIKNEDIKNRISDETLQKIENLDIDVTGRIVRRWGYEEWEHFITLLEDYPEVTNLQRIYQYIDVGGEKRIFVVANGFLYMQFKDDEGKLQWQKLNKEQFFDIDGRIAITTYFDRVFFNDKGENVWVYDVKNQRFNGYYIEFTGNKIKFYDIQTFAEKSSLEIEISPTSTAKIGQELYNDIIAGLGVGSITIDINWFERDQRGNYYLLNLGATDENDKQLFKINKSLVFNDALTFADPYATATPNTGKLRIMQFGLWGQEIFVWGEQDRIHVVNTETFTADTNRTLIKNWYRFPVDQNNNRISYIYANEDKLYIYSHGVDSNANIPLFAEKIKFLSWRNGIIVANTYADGQFISVKSEENENGVNIQYRRQSGWKSKKNPKFYIQKYRGDLGFINQSAYSSDYVHSTGHGDNWQVRGILTQSQYEEYLSPIRIYTYTYGWVLYNNYINVYAKYDNFFKKAAALELRLAYNFGIVEGIAQWRLENGWISENDTSFINNLYNHSLNNRDNSSFISNLEFTQQQTNLTKYHTVYAKLTGSNGSGYINDIFNNLSESKYNSLVVLNNISGKMTGHKGIATWLPLTLRGEGAEITDFDKAFNPIFIYRNLLHFGDWFNNKKYFYSYDINTTKYNLRIKNESLDTHHRVINFLQSALGLSYKEGGTDNKNAIYERLENIDQAPIIEYNNYINSNIKDYETYAEDIIVKRLNTPDAPKYKVNIDVTSNLKIGFYRYSMIFVFGNVSPPQRTLMGIQTPTIEIAQDNTFEIEVYDIITGLFYNSGTQDSDVTAIELYRQDSADGFNWNELPYLITAITQTGANEDILSFLASPPSDPNINDTHIATATGGDWTINNIYTWAGSSWAEKIPQSGYIILNADDSKYYQWDGSLWNNIGDYVDKYIDDQSNADYSPKNYYQETLEGRRFKVSWIDIHKSKLVLLPKLDEENSNIVLASAIDNPEDIPPDVQHARPIESGDGDTLVGGKSSREYYFLFKHARIYAIYGDIITGALLDIDKKVGTSNPNMIVELSGLIYFMNKKAIYRIAGLKVQNIEFERLKDLFNPEKEESINFEQFDKIGFAFADRSREEIRFHIPTGDNDYNDTILIYNTRFNYWRIYRYYHSPLDLNDIFDIGTDKRIFLMLGKAKENDGTTTSKIYKLVRDNNDDGKKIRWQFTTKAFTLGAMGLKKAFKIARITGKYFTDIALNYIINDDYKWGDVNLRKEKNYHIAETLIYNGNSNNIAIDCLSEDANRDPIEIDELLIGYDNIKRMR